MQIMKTIQGELWRNLMSVLEELSVFDESYTKRVNELNKIFYENYYILKELLTEDQRLALGQLVDLATLMETEQQEIGVALGFALARDIRQFLDNPIDAHRQAVMSYRPVHKTRLDLKETFDKLQKKSGDADG